MAVACFDVGHFTNRDDAVDGGPCTQSLYWPLLSEACIRYKSSKSHLRLIRGSMILDHIRTRFLGGDLYASIYGSFRYTSGVCKHNKTILS